MNGVWQYPPVNGPWYARCSTCDRELGSHRTRDKAMGQFLDHIARKHPEHRVIPSGPGITVAHWYCPRCSCNKSGHAADANLRTEACNEHDCPCHDEDKEMP